MIFFNPFHKCQSFVCFEDNFYYCEKCHKIYYDVVTSKADEDYTTQMRRCNKRQSAECKTWDSYKETLLKYETSH